MSKVAHSFKEKERTGDVKISEQVAFDGLFLSNEVLNGLKNAGFERPSPIQLKAIPLGRCGLDLIVQAKSGTGKTCVFSVIALESIHTDTTATQVLVLAPTREIAVQIWEVVNSIGSAVKNLQCHTFIGGLPVHEDRNKLKNCHIAVGSPGRIKQLIESGVLRTDSIRLFVLDEADKLLEEGFQDQINWIYSTLPDNKQMLALSATYPEYLADHLTAYMRNPTFLRLNISDPALLGIRQYYATVAHHPVSHVVFEEKVKVLTKLLSSISFQQCLIFSNLQTRAQNLSELLTGRGWPTACIAGCLDQKDRNHAMAKLKSYKCRILISTDLTSRGIDADKVNMVVNLDIPKDHETYLHRIGRAGRFGSFGIAISLVSAGHEMLNLNTIEKRCNTKLSPLPEPLPSDLARPGSPVFLDDVVSTETIHTETTDTNMDSKHIKYNHNSTSKHRASGDYLFSSDLKSCVNDSMVFNGGAKSGPQVNGETGSNTDVGQEAQPYEASQEERKMGNNVLKDSSDIRGLCGDVLVNGGNDKCIRQSLNHGKYGSENLPQAVEVVTTDTAKANFEDNVPDTSETSRTPLHDMCLEETTFDNCSIDMLEKDVIIFSKEKKNPGEGVNRRKNNYLLLDQGNQKKENVRQERTKDNLTLVKTNHQKHQKTMTKDCSNESKTSVFQRQETGSSTLNAIEVKIEESHGSLISAQGNEIESVNCHTGVRSQESRKCVTLPLHAELSLSQRNMAAEDVNNSPGPKNRQLSVADIATCHVNLPELYRRTSGFKRVTNAQTYDSARQSLLAFREQYTSDTTFQQSSCTITPDLTKSKDIETLYSNIAKVQELLERVTLNCATSDIPEHVQTEKEGVALMKSEAKVQNSIVDTVIKQVGLEQHSSSTREADSATTGIALPLRIETNSAMRGADRETNTNRTTTNETKSTAQITGASLDSLSEQPSAKRPTKEVINRTRRTKIGYQGKFAIGHILQNELQSCTGNMESINPRSNAMSRDSGVNSEANLSLEQYLPASDNVNQLDGSGDRIQNWRQSKDSREQLHKSNTKATNVNVTIENTAYNQKHAITTNITAERILDTKRLNAHGSCDVSNGLEESSDSSELTTDSSSDSDTDSITDTENSDPSSSAFDKNPEMPVKTGRVNSGSRDSVGKHSRDGRNGRRVCKDKLFPVNESGQNCGSGQHRVPYQYIERESADAVVKGRRSKKGKETEHFGTGNHTKVRNLAKDAKSFPAYKYASLSQGSSRSHSENSYNDQMRDWYAKYSEWYTATMCRPMSTGPVYHQSHVPYHSDYPYHASYWPGFIPPQLPVPPLYNPTSLPRHPTVPTSYHSHGFASKMNHSSMHSSDQVMADACSFQDQYITEMCSLGDKRKDRKKSDKGKLNRHK